MNQTAPEIEVLLATYNGAAYLEAQVESVLQQSGVPVRLLARDDGSGDSTAHLLSHFEQQHPERFRVLRGGASTGAAKRNFLELLKASDADHVAFCDQDDVWMPDKLDRSMAAMRLLEASRGSGVPLAVYTDLRVVDASLQTVHPSLWAANGLVHAASPTLASLLMENVATGCTMLLNRALVRAMRAMPEAAQMHDHWAALIACSTGALHAIADSTVLYRQHGSNVVGAKAETTLRAKASRLWSMEAFANRRAQHARDHAQAEALLQLHGSSMTASAREIVEAFLSLRGASRLQRLRTAARYRFQRGAAQQRLADLLDTLRGS